MNSQEIVDWLNQKVEQYNQPSFIENDPLCIPHRFSRLQDIEIAGFLAAILAWGQRKVIIQKCLELLQRMDNAPYDFVCHHQENDLKAILGFKHRTFNDTDALYFIAFLKQHYQQSRSLETAFSQFMLPEDTTVANGLIGFQRYFSSLPYFPKRTGKHISSPSTHSACKRLNMFLRWMVRKDSKGVDLGIWQTITPRQLICPLDVHVERVARKLHLLRRPHVDWQAAVELTDFFRTIDPDDPVRYDFALFGLGLEGFAT